MASKKSTTKAKTKNSKTVKFVKTSKVTITSRQALSLPRLQLISGVAFLIAAVAAVLLMSSATYATTISYLTLDKLQGGAISPAYRQFFDIELRWLLISTLVLSAVAPLLHATKMKQKFANALKSKVMPWRWVEWAVLTSLVTATVVLLTGYQDIVTIKLFGIVILVIGLLSWCAEREAKLGNSKIAKGSHLVALLLAVAVVVLVGFSLVATPIYGQVRAAWYVYAVFGVLVADLALRSINQYNQLRAYKNWKSYEVVERNHTVITLVSRVALAVILIVGLAK